MPIAYLSASPGIPLQGPSGASAHIRDLVSALRCLDTVDLFVPQIMDRRGAFGPSVEAIETGVVGWPTGSGIGVSTEKFAFPKRLARHALKRHVRWDLVIERHSLFSNAGRTVADHQHCPLVLEVNAPLWRSGSGTKPYTGTVMPKIGSVMAPRSRSCGGCRPG